MTTSPFLDLLPGSILDEDDLVIVLRDRYPVSPGHALVVPRRVVSRLDELTPAEHQALWQGAERIRRHLARTLDPAPTAFNLGINDGADAGQTVAHLHLHVIPRYPGDMPDPRGGVRWVLPRRARYWDDPPDGSDPGAPGRDRRSGDPDASR